MSGPERSVYGMLHAKEKLNALIEATYDDAKYDMLYRDKISEKFEIQYTSLW